MAFAQNDNGDDPNYKSDRYLATIMHIDDAVYATSGVPGMVDADSAINAMTLEQKKVSKDIGISDPGQGLYGQSFYLPFKMILRASDCNDGGMYGDNGPTARHRVPPVNLGGCGSCCWWSNRNGRTHLPSG